MNICKKYEPHTFDEYDYLNVIFSGDSIPVCPICRMSPYEKQFNEFHESVGVEVEE